MEKDVELEPIMTKHDEGKILFLSFLYEKQLFQIINIYAPTNPSRKNKFFRNLKNYKKTQNNLILAADFNMVEVLLLNRKGGNPNTSIS